VANTRSEPGRFIHPGALALTVAIPLTLIYLILSPPAGDLAAATYRSALFGRAGFTTWDTGWYAAHGHWLPGYSLLAPALGWLLGVHVLLVLSAIAACALFGMIARQAFEETAARVAAVTFAVGFCVELLSGRVPYDLGFAIGLGAVLALMRGATPLALALAVATSVASPVAGAFLAMAGLAGGLAGAFEKSAGPARAHGGLTAQERLAGAPEKSVGPARAHGGLTAQERLAGAPEKSAGPPRAHGAYAAQSNGPTSATDRLASPHIRERGTRAGERATLSIALSIAIDSLAALRAFICGTGAGERGAPLTIDRLTRHCFALSGASLAPIVVLNLAFPEGGYEPFAPSLFWLSLGGVLLIALLLPQGPLSARARRVVRLGAALYGLALIGSFVIATPLGGNAARLGPPLAAPLMAGVLWEHRRAALLWLAPLLVYWQLVTPINDVAASVGNPSASATYYTPLLSELERLRHGAPTIVEVPLLESHWEAAFLPGHDGISLARGWDRQLDTLYGAIFYRKTLSPAAYRAWLLENKVYYVALADAPLDGAGRLEGKLVAGGLPYLRELWHSAHWRLYRVMG
jgi:hypothetical protein